MSTELDSTGSAETQRLRDAEEHYLQELAQLRIGKDQALAALAQMQEAHADCANIAAENSILRFAMGVQPAERVPLDQTPQHGSVSVERGSMRMRVCPCDEENVRLQDERRKLLEMLNTSALLAGHDGYDEETELWRSVADHLNRARDTALEKIDALESENERLRGEVSARE